MQNKIKYHIQLITVCTGAVMLSYGLSQIPNNYFATPHFWIPTLFFAITTLLINWILTMGEKDSKEFVFKTLAFSMARLLLCMIVVFVYSLINKEQSLSFAVHFMIQYLLFTIFEISFLLKYIKS